MTQIKKLEVLPLVFYEFELPEDLKKLALTGANAIDWDTLENRSQKPYFGKTIHGINSWHTKPKYKKLVDFIEEKLELVRIDQNYEYIEKLKVSILWANKSTEGQWHHTHVHPWSVLSGIIYLQGDSGRTWFARTNEYHTVFKCPLCNPEVNNPDLLYKHEFKSGTMLIFPSCIAHSVEATTSNTPRVTAAFNSFVAGLSGRNEDLNSVNITID